MTKSNLSKSQLAQLEALPTTSARIRYLAGQGLTRGQIAKTLGIRYQHVRNVLITPLKGA
jgi:hypothetical protein